MTMTNNLRDRLEGRGALDLFQWNEGLRCLGDEGKGPLEPSLCIRGFVRVIMPIFIEIVLPKGAWISKVGMGEIRPGENHLFVEMTGPASIADAQEFSLELLRVEYPPEDRFGINFNLLSKGMDVYGPFEINGELCRVAAPRRKGANNG